MVKKKKSYDGDNLICDECNYVTPYLPKDSIGKECPNCGTIFKGIETTIETLSFCKKCNDQTLHSITLQVAEFTKKGYKTEITQLICHNCGYKRGG